MIALAIVALTAAVLLDRRVDVVRDTARARELRSAWMLASQKIAEMELEPGLWEGVGGQSHGDFGEFDPSYSGFQWEYLIERHPVEADDPVPGAVQGPPKPRELMKLTLGVKAPGLDDPVILQALFPIFDPRTVAGAASEPTPPDAEPGPPSNGPGRGAAPPPRRPPPIRPPGRPR
jgi:hypothetical protein